MNSIFIGQFSDILHYGMFVGIKNVRNARYSYAHLNDMGILKSIVFNIDIHTMMFHYNQNQFKLELICG